MDQQQDGFDLGEGGRDPFFGFGSFDMYDTGGGSTGWGMGQGGGMHSGGQGQAGIDGGDVGEYRMHSRGAMPMGYRRPQYLHAHHMVHRGEPVPSQNPHVRPLHAHEYQRRVEMPMCHPEPQPRAQASQLPAPMAKLPPHQQHQQQKCMGIRAPATPTIAVTKRARDEPVIALPSDATSSKRSRAEKHYREIRLLCDALSPHIAHVQVMYVCMYVFAYVYLFICMYVCT